jgi:hypothetical protein
MVLDTHSIRQFPLHFLSRASPCAITFQLDYACTRALYRAVHESSYFGYKQTRLQVRNTCTFMSHKYLDLMFFLAHSFTFRRWVLSRGDTRGDAWWRKLKRLTQITQAAVHSKETQYRPKFDIVCTLYLPRVVHSAC